MRPSGRGGYKGCSTAYHEADVPETKAPPFFIQIAFAAACAVCGLFTAYYGGFEPSRYWPFYRGVLPFCILLTAVCVRPFQLIPISLIGCLLSWRLAFFTMTVLGSVINGNDSLLIRFLYWAGTGLIGALGVAASVGIGAKTILKPKRFFLIGAAGMLAAVLFTAGSSIGLYIGLAVWQAAIGVVIFHVVKMPKATSL